MGHAEPAGVRAVAVREPCQHRRLVGARVDREGIQPHVGRVAEQALNFRHPVVHPEARENRRRLN